MGATARSLNQENCEKENRQQNSGVSGVVTRDLGTIRHITAKIHFQEQISGACGTAQLGGLQSSGFSYALQTPSPYLPQVLGWLLSRAHYRQST